MSATLRKERTAEAVTLRFDTTRAVLLPTLAKACAATQRRCTIPILANVLIRGWDDKISITGTDMETTICASFDAVCSIQGATTLPAAPLRKIVSSLDDGQPLAVEVRGDAAYITAGDFTCQLMTQPAEDFPTPFAPKWANEFTLSTADLASMIKRTSFAISTEETRYYLNGIYFHIMHGEFQLCATDGHRLALCKIAAPDGAANMPGNIVPRRAISLLAPLLKGGDIRISVSEPTGKPYVRFVVGDTTLDAKSIDGTFPDYERVIPKDNDKTIIVETTPFSRALSRVSCLSTERHRAVKIELSRERLILSACSAENGTASNSLYVDYTGAAMQVGFQVRYVEDILKVCKSRTRIVCADGSSPTIFADADDASATFVLMPMRV